MSHYGPPVIPVKRLCHTNIIHGDFGVIRELVLFPQVFLVIVLWNEFARTKPSIGVAILIAIDHEEKCLLEIQELLVSLPNAAVGKPSCIISTLTLPHIHLLHLFIYQ